MCHLILLLPVISLPIFWLLPPAIAAAIYIPILALSLWVYWFVMQSMRRPVETGQEELLGATGRVTEARGESVWVRVHSEIWSAISSEPLKPDDAVEVIGIDGLKLRVRRAGSTPSGTRTASRRPPAARRGGASA